MSLGINKLEAIELPKPKYIDDNGVEQDVDLKIVASSDPMYEFENVTNLIKTYFKKNICNYSPVKVVVGDTFFEWTPFGVGFSDEHGNEEWFGRVNSVDGIIQDENTIVYKGLIKDIDDEFIVKAGELKHNIILSSKPVYNNNLPGKQISIVVDGKIDFSDGVYMYVDGIEQIDEFETSSSIEFKNNIGEIIFTLPSPVAYEVNGNETAQCFYKVTKTGNIITLKIFTPFSWLDKINRIYPVAIDPTLTIIPNSITGFRLLEGNISKSGKYIAFGSGTTPFPGQIFSFDETTGQISTLPAPSGGFPGRADRFAIVSPNDKHFIYGGYGSVRVYKYDDSTKSFTTPLNLGIGLSSAGAYLRWVDFSRNGEYIIISEASNIRIYNYDEMGDTASNVKIKPMGGNVGKSLFVRNSRYIFSQVDSNLKILKFENGDITYEYSTPSELNNSVVDFCTSFDGSFVGFILNKSPYLSVYEFDERTGNLINPSSASNLSALRTPKITFSRLNHFLILSEGNNPKIKIYRMDLLNRVIDGSFIDIGTVGNQIGTDIRGMFISPNGEYLLINDFNLHVYKFFYEPENNVFFRDPITKDYYSDNKGNTLMLIDFGTIVAGQTTSPKKILLENCYDYAVNNIQLSISNPSQEFRVELSETVLPFIPQQTLSFNQTLNTRESIPFYIRVTTTDQSQSGGMFEVLAKCDVV